MNKLLDMIAKFSSYIGLAVIALSLLGGFINGLVIMFGGYGVMVWAGFYTMVSTWIGGIAIGVLLITAGAIYDRVKS